MKKKRTDEEKENLRETLREQMQLKGRQVNEVELDLKLQKFIEDEGKH